MGVMGMIAKAKGKFHQRKMDVMQKKTDKIRAQNIKEAEITEAKRALREAQQIKEDLRRDQMETIEKAGPSKLQRLGAGLEKHLKSQKTQGPGLRIGAVRSTGSKGLDMSSKGSETFGGSKNFDVGGSGSGKFNFGPTPKPKPMKKPGEGTTIIIKSR